MPSEKPTEPPSADGNRPSADGLEAVIEQYLEELASGDAPDQESYLRAHPHLAGTLRGVFKTLDFVEATGRTLNASCLGKDQLLGDFRIIGEVGRGGMGVVYEAIQTSLDRRVALKVLPAGAILADSAAERFVREASMAGQLHHTNIVPVYAVGEEQGINYYAMQFIDGGSLSALLKEWQEGETKRTADHHRRVARWGQKVAEALACAHAEGIIHRDIKPSNLLLDKNDKVWVSDFGLARASALATITGTGDVIGTARYMSPEQARGDRGSIDARSDIYSLGATLYELLALEPSYRGESREEVLNRVAASEPVPLRKIDPTIPRDLETIVFRCMRKEPARRYANAGDLAEDCRRFLAGESICARRTPLLVKAARFVKKHRLRIAGAAIVIVLALVTLLMVMKDRHAKGELCVADALRAILFDRDDDRATALLDEAHALGIDSAQLYLYRGLIPLMNVRPHDAVGLFEEAYERDPQSAEACYALAQAFWGIADIATSRDYFERAQALEIDSSLGWWLRGNAMSYMAGAESVESYNKAIALRPDFTPAIEARAHTRAQQLLRRDDETLLVPMIEDYDAWVIFQPESPRSYTSRGFGYLIAACWAERHAERAANRTEWLAQAARDLDKALTLRTEADWKPLIAKATFLRVTGDFEGASGLFAEANATSRKFTGKNHPGMLHQHAIVLHATGQIDAALAKVDAAIESWSPGLFPLPLQKGILLAELGRLDEARAACAKGLNPDEANATSILMTAAGMELLGDRDASERALGEFEQNVGRDGLTEAGQAGLLPALDYLLGRIDAEGLIDAAGGRYNELCEILFLIALRQLGDGDRDAGIATLKACRDTGMLVFVPYRFTQAMLARAAVVPGWPLWLPPADRDAPAEAEAPSNDEASSEGGGGQ